MKIVWGWDDGYVGGRPKHTLEIPDEELEGFSDVEKNQIIDDAVREAFEQQVNYFWRVK